MIDIESRVAESLTARADRPVEVDRLRASALTRARTIRRRRRALGAAALALVVALVVAGSLAGPRFLRVAPSGVPRPTTLPEAVGVAPAAERPQDVGMDPGVLHFDLDLTSLRPDATEWVSGNGYERAIVYSAGEQPWAQVYIAHSVASLAVAVAPTGSLELTTVDGRPAALRRVVDEHGRVTWDLRWEPLGGVQAAVFVNGDDRGLAATVARALRFDHAQRCAVPAHLTELPTGSRWIECRTMVRTVSPGRWAHSALVIRDGDGHEALIWLVPATSSSAFAPNRTVGGLPAEWSTTPDSLGLWMPEVGGLDLFIGENHPERGEWLNEAYAVHLMERLEVATDLESPATWAVRAVG
jgi:hypothetical protein